MLGLRPTDLAIRTRPSRRSVALRVDFAGGIWRRDVFVDLALGDAERLRIRASPENSVSLGERIEARIALAALHLFDAEGASLRRPAQGDA